MKPKKRVEVAKVVRDILNDPAMPYHVLTVTFEDGQSIDVPYQPWKPRQSLSLPGKWVR